MITFITPVAPAHTQYLAECAASVEAQTVASKHLIEIDHKGEGPAVIRNRLLARVETEFVSFLDADDWLEPDFTERMLAAYHPGRYVYSDWYQDGEHTKAPPRAWCAGTWHVVTALYPTHLVRLVGGFDETLSALEDTDLALKVVTRNICGVRVPYPLMHYRANGGRALNANVTGMAQQIQLELSKRYGAIKMACCGNEETINQAPLGVQQPGDVLAQALWGGNRAEHGRATGRPYPRMSFPATTWVDPRDIQAAPSLWREALPTSELDPIKSGEGMPAIVGGMVAQGIFTTPPYIPPPVAVEVKPNFDKVRKATRKAKKND